MTKRKRSSAASNVRKRAEKHMTGGSTMIRIPDGVSMFKPKNKAIVDILSYVVGEGNPWADKGELHYERTFYAHRNVGAESKSYVCPKMTAGKKCPICEYAAKLSKKSNVDPQMVKDLRPQERQLFNTKDYAAPEKGWQIWDNSFYCFGKTLDGVLSDSDPDEDGFDTFSDLDGLSLRLGIDQESGGDFTFDKVNRIVFKNRKPYTEAELEKLHCLDELLVILSYDELKAKFFEIEDADGEDDIDEPAPKKAKKAAPVDDDDFDDDDDFE